MTDQLRAGRPLRGQRLPMGGARQLARRGLLAGGPDHHRGRDLGICAAMTVLAHRLV